MPHTRPSQETRIAIVGAGIAGLNAALTLQDAGLAWVLPLSVVDNSINLCKYTSGWFFRHGAVRTGHLILK
jgi:thioredoxin reductase